VFKQGVAGGNGEAHGLVVELVEVHAVNGGRQDLALEETFDDVVSLEFNFGGVESAVGFGDLGGGCGCGMIGCGTGVGRGFEGDASQGEVLGWCNGESEVPVGAAAGCLVPKGWTWHCC
jgi:hypothetical protein